MYHYRVLKPPPKITLTTAARLDREERRRLQAEIVELAERIYPTAGRATVDTRELLEGWDVVVLLGTHRLHLSGMRNERIGLIAAVNRLRKQLRHRLP